MNIIELDKSFKTIEKQFRNYIDSIKSVRKSDIYDIINVTLISNPYNTNFPKKFFLKEEPSKSNILYLFIKSTLKFYFKQLYFFIMYIITFCLFKLFYKKKINTENTILIDIFFLVDNVIKDKEFNEKYFLGLYGTLKKDYIFLPRLYGIDKNPFKLIEFFKIISKDKRKFLFEFELLSFKNFLEIFKLITLYPFKTLRVIQKDELFNIELIKDIEKQSFNSFSRYILGKNIAKLKIKKIYSWSEFQVIERAFNYGIRTNNKSINIYACQFYLNYKTYFNSYIYDIDFDMLSSPHIVLVNGEYYLLDRERVKYRRGVSLRYKEIFNFKRIEKEKYILLLGSYIEMDTKYMLNSVNRLDNILFKNHPAININRFGELKNIKVVTDNIYELFKESYLVISTASGTAVEAVACGLSVIIIASQDNFTLNPLVDYGKGKIWDIAFSKDDVEILYNKLLKYRRNNIEEIKEIASWYKDNFFVEPTEENIIKVFELDKD